MSNSKSNRNDQGDQASGCCGGLFGTKTVAKGGESTENRDSDINGTGEVPAGLSVQYNFVRFCSQMFYG